MLENKNHKFQNENNKNASKKQQKATKIQHKICAKGKKSLKIWLFLYF